MAQIKDDSTMAGVTLVNESKTQTLTNKTLIEPNISGALIEDSTLTLNTNYKYQEIWLPKNILFYYGYVSSFNHDTNAWFTERVARDMAQYDVIVFGNTVGDPAHPDYAKFIEVITRIKQIKPSVICFGYASINLPYAEFTTKCDQWNNIPQIDGIFFDECGYDYHVTRQQMNLGFDYVHALRANICFVNGWNIKYVLGTDDLNEGEWWSNNDWNPSEDESSLNENDWYLLESYPVNTWAYTGTSGCLPMFDWIARGEIAVEYREKYGIILASTSQIEVNYQTPEIRKQLADFCYQTALIFSLDAYSISSKWYGAVDPNLPIYEMLVWENMGIQYECRPYLALDPFNWQYYFRNTSKGKIDINFIPTIPEVSWSHNTAKRTWLEEDITDLDHSAVRIQGREITSAGVPVDLNVISWNASSAEWQYIPVSGTGGITNHSDLFQLDYTSSGHTGFSSAGHIHDSRYYTETELNAGQLDNRYYTESEIDSTLVGYSITGHTHDDRYYTESEIDSTLVGYSVTGHTHDDRYYTETEIDLTLVGYSVTGHNHDDRYYTESEIDSILSGYSVTGHNHTESDITDLEHNAVKIQGRNVSNSDVPTNGQSITWDETGSEWRYTSVSGGTSGGAGTTNHSELNELDYASAGHTGFASAGHNHTESDITDLDHDAVKIRGRNVSDSDVPTDGQSITWSAALSAWNYTSVSGGGGTTNHSELNELDYASAGHTGFASASHIHDDRYYTESEIDSTLVGYSVTGHTHDDRYYTETEIDSTLTGYSVTGHNHDDEYYTESELNAGQLDNRYYTETEIDSTLTGYSVTGHIHDTRYYTETEIDTWRNSTTQTEMGHVHGVSSDIQTQLNTKIPKIINAVPSSTKTSNGPQCETISAGEDISQMQSVFLHTDGEWHKTDVSNKASSDGLIAIALTSGGDGTAIKVALPDSFVRDDTWNWNIGAKIYLGAGTSLSWSIGGNLSSSRDAPGGFGTQIAANCFGGAWTYATSEEYNGSAWSAGGTLSTARREPAGAGTLTAGLAFGGVGPLNSTEEYNGTAWSGGGTLNTARYGLGGCGLQTAGLSVGGNTGSWSTVTEKYNGTAWTNSGALGTARYTPGVFGNQIAAMAAGGIYPAVTTEEFNGSTWSAGGNVTTARYAPGAFGSLNNGAICGGWNGAALYSSTEEYNGNSWSAGGTINTARYTLVACGAKASGLCFAGYAGGYSAVTEEYGSTATMTQIAPSGGEVIRTIGYATHANRMYFCPHENQQNKSIGLSAYANNAAAKIGGLVAGDLFRTSADPSVVCVVT